MSVNMEIINFLTEESSIRVKFQRKAIIFINVILIFRTQ